MHARSATQRMARNVTIFDWDDTLFPTTWFLSQTAAREMKQQLLRDVDEAVAVILGIATDRGDVAIVTCASERWVRETAKYLPGASNFLFGTVQVISCKDRFFAGTTHALKTRAFLSVLEELRANNNDAALNICSVGDSGAEYFAAKASALEHDIVKRVRLWQSPSLSVLSKQLELLSGRFEEVLSHATPADIIFEMRPKADKTDAES